MRAVRAAASVGVLALVAVTVGTGLAASPSAEPSEGATGASAVPAGLPSGVPQAALDAPATLATPDGWPLAEPFPRTSGTGRLGGGVFGWSDFVYDDHGAGGPVPTPVEPEVVSLAPTAGTYTYPDGPASGNGADVFRTAFALDGDDAYLRVDWQTLADPAVPIAAFGLDTTPATSSEGTGAPTPFAGDAGVSAEGLERTLLVSSQGATLVEAVTGTSQDVEDDLGGSLTVDPDTQSFVVRLPREALAGPAGGVPSDGAGGDGLTLAAAEDTWRLWLVAGLADEGGTGFAPPPEEVVPGQARVYNAAFRDYADEPTSNNFWFENTQAAQLTQGDVTPFSVDVDTAALDAERSTPEPTPTGYSNRWYVSSLDLGDGVVPDEGNGRGDLRPNFLGRVQPYGIYVPSGYDPAEQAPLSWVLHSLGVQHNQYGALDPRQLQQTCEDRGSICATTLARGPDTWYFDEAELDFWEVWRDLAEHYTLDPERTILTGYSMGGLGTYKLGAAYPDLFAQALVLAGPPTCGTRVAGDVRNPGGPGRCTTDSDTKPLLPNFRYIPITIGQGAIDELVPVTSVVEQVQAADAAGLRYQFHLYPAAGHLAWALSDGFDNETATLLLRQRVTRPGQVDYAFYPNLVRDDLGFGPDGAYWLTGLVGRDDSPGTLARASAVSAARPEPEITLVEDQGALPPPDNGYPGPGASSSQSWQLGDTPAPEPRVDLSLEGVSEASLDVIGAGVAAGGPASVPVTTDGPTTVTLTGLASGTTVLRDGTPVGTAGSNGTVAAALQDDATLTFPAAATSSGGSGGDDGTAGDDDGTAGAGDGTATGGSGTAGTADRTSTAASGASTRQLASTGLLDVLPLLGVALTAVALVSGQRRARRRPRRAPEA